MPRAALFLVPSLFFTSVGYAQWVEFVDVTDSALVLDDLYKTNDNIEKDFEWGDFDKDGDKEEPMKEAAKEGKAQKFKDKKTEEVKKRMRK